MSELVLNEETDIAKSKKLLADYQEANYTSKITAERGRLIRLIKKLIRKLRSNPNPTEEDNQKIEEAENLLSDELFKHEIQLKERYSNEFVQKEAKVPDVVTTLPMGVALQTKRLANSINEVKNAKGAKGRAIAMKNAFKDLGLLVGTPIYFAGKFIVEHWYLILLLLDWDRRKKKKKKKEEEDNKGREQPQEVPETVVEKELEEARAAALAEEERKQKEGVVEEPELDPSPVMASDEIPSIVPSLSSARVPNVKIENNEPVVLPDTQTVLGPIASTARNIKPVTINPEPELQPILSSARDIKPIKTDTESVLEPIMSSAREIKPVAIAEQGVAPVAVLDNPELLADLHEVDQTCAEFIGDMEDRFGYNFFVASRHPEIKVVHSAEEFIEAAGTGTVEQAENMYNSTLGLRPIDRAIVWPEIDPEMRFFENDAVLAEYISSNEEPALTDFFNRYANEHQEQITKVTTKLGSNAQVEYIDGKPYIVDHTYGDPVCYPVSPQDARRFEETGVFSPTVGLGLSLFTVGPMSLPTFSFGGVPVLVP